MVFVNGLFFIINIPTVYLFYVTSLCGQKMIKKLPKRRYTDYIMEPSSTSAPQVPPPTKRNLYLTARHILLVALVLLGLSLIVFLIHQNGKSIYDNGI